MAERDKVRYMNELQMMKRYNENGPNSMIATSSTAYGSSMACSPQIQQSTGRKTKKQVKDPNAPKRPHSAFLLYCADHRAIVRRQYPQLFGVGV